MKCDNRAKQELKKPTLVERADNKDTESLYETVWINPEPKPEMIERAQAYGLLLSRIPVCTNLSKDWQSACVTDELDLSSLLATKTWPLIVFLSSGHEEGNSTGGSFASLKLQYFPGLFAMRGHICPCTIRKHSLFLRLW